MSVISFYPGPSRLYDKIPQYIQEGFEEGIISANHRSDEFMGLMGKVKDVLRTHLSVPDDYDIAFFSSATECWEVLAQSLIVGPSQHFYNGSFGEKWADCTHKITDQATRIHFNFNDPLPVQKLDTSVGCICITQNETSNGTEIPVHQLKKLKGSVGSGQLVAVDATSSMAGRRLDIGDADIWFASVQKCFGLPSGLAIMLLSPSSAKRAYDINERTHYNSLVYVLDNTRKNQAQHTPNILDIYLLYRSMNDVGTIHKIDKKVMDRYHDWVRIINELTDISWLITNEDVRSKTVLALSTVNPAQLLKKAKNAGLILGKGYGEWKESTFRIANFPALKGNEIQELITFLKREYH